MILDSIGDVNPIEYGGGVVVDHGHGPQIEYTHGLDFDGADPAAMVVYQVPVEDDVFGWHDWADIKGIASFVDSTPAELRAAGKSLQLMERVWATECIADYHGWVNLDEYPITLSEEELEERWELD